VTGGVFMKIVGNTNVQSVMKAYGKNVGKTKKTEGIKFESDKIEISQEAHDFQVAMKAFKDLPDVREDKVSELKEQVNSGSYKPSSEDVMNKLLSRLEGAKK